MSRNYRVVLDFSQVGVSQGNCLALAQLWCCGVWFADGILLAMNERAKTGFHELDHTADVELLVWGPDLPLLLEQSALGMYSLAGIQLKPGPAQTRILELPVADPESLLVNFLSELLFLLEMEEVGFNHIKISIDASKLHAELKGKTLESQAKQIKAVTYHNLEVHPGLDGLEARIVFDV
ncbi:MAG: archease [Anaerolineales bacterium]|nr:archease [Anaerolineales bacterium]